MICPKRRRIGKRFVVVLRDFGDSFKRFARPELLFQVACVEMASSRTRKIRLAISFFTEKNREGIHRRVAFIHESYDAAAVGATTQIRAKLPRLATIEMRVHRGAHPFPNLVCPMSFVQVVALWVFEVP